MEKVKSSVDLPLRVHVERTFKTFASENSYQRLVRKICDKLTKFWLKSAHERSLDLPEI